MTGSTVSLLRRVVAVAAIGAVAVLVAGCSGSEPEVDESSPTTETATPSPEPASSPSPSATAQHWPPAELDTADTVSAVDANEPEAYEAAPWIWDWVDDTWSVAVYSTVEVMESPDGGPVMEGVQHLYLVAPDGAAFRVMDLGNQAWANIVDWDPEHGTAWLFMQGFGESWDVVEVDLIAGALNDGDFTDGAGPRRTAEELQLSPNVLPAAWTEDGAVLWVDSDPFGGASGGVSWYDPATGAWTGSKINDLFLSLAQERMDLGEGNPSIPHYASGSGWFDVGEGRALYVTSTPGGGEYPSPIRYMVLDHDLAADTWVSAEFVGPSEMWCGAYGPADDGVVAICGGTDASVPDRYFVVDPASGALDELSADDVPQTDHDLGSYTVDVKANGATPPGADAWTDVMPAPASAR